MDDWLSQLNQIREEHIQKAQPEPEISAQPSGHQLLQDNGALKYLRDIRKVLLNGVGRIEFLENAGGYEVLVALTWDGPASNPKPPVPESPEMRHIFVGVKDGGLWVNGKRVRENTEEALQQSLLEAAREPGTRSDLRR